ncbi:MAG: response regulator transcription factor [Acidimicrobiia bacterium]|nr:response regulator transcription factor [Acidimicrobiia bacterium]
MQIAALPAALSPGLTEALLLGGIAAKLLEDADVSGTDTSEWLAVIVELGEDPLRRLREASRLVSDTGLPVIVVAERDQLPLVDAEQDLTDFIIGPPDPLELKVRLERLTKETIGTKVLEYRDLALNTATYQATVGSRPVDLTYMEYELLRYFVENQGRVWSREQLLSRVWGYDYFGGARTVDVHVRRLRSKLGEERSSWITTVRSVGYRFG